MVRERVLPVLASVAVIVLVAIIQERSRHLAAVLASMPLTAPLALWIVFSATKGDHRQTADFAASMLMGVIGALAFVVACWFGFSRQWNFGLVLGFGAVAWFVIVVVSRYWFWR
ncbi:MAG: hypothetical protein ACRDQ2_16965 [Gaiellales bacterium]